jgi:hypothetical protein
MPDRAVGAARGDHRDAGGEMAHHVAEALRARRSASADDQVPYMPSSSWLASAQYIVYVPAASLKRRALARRRIVVNASTFGVGSDPERVAEPAAVVTVSLPLPLGTWIHCGRDQVVVERDVNVPRSRGGRRAAQRERAEGEQRSGCGRGASVPYAVAPDDEARRCC